MPRYADESGYGAQADAMARQEWLDEQEAKRVCPRFPTPHCRALGCIFPWNREDTVCEADVTTSLAAQIGAMWDAHELQHLLRE